MKSFEWRWMRLRMLLLLVPMLVLGCTPLVGDEPPPFRPTATRATAARPTPTPRSAIVEMPARPQPTVRSAGAPTTPAPGDSAGQDAWLRRAGLEEGIADPGWDALRREAIDDGAVVIYSDTARMSRAAPQLSAMLPGIECSVWVANSQDIALRLAQEQAAEAYVGDVYLSSDPLRTGDLLAEGTLWRYRPSADDETSDGSSDHPPVVHHWSALLVAGNAPALEGEAIDSLWDLTRPEWRGRIAMPDPLIDQRMLCLLVAATEHADELAAAYAVEYGRPIQLDDDCADAGYCWIQDLLGNDPRLCTSDAEVAEYVGEREAAEARVGLVGYEQYAKVGWEELAFEPIPNVSPVGGLYWATYLAIVNRSQHPSAARLAIRWLMGEGRDAAHDSPWFEPGFYLEREGAPDPPGAMARDELLEGLWILDPGADARGAHDMYKTVAGILGVEVGGR